MAVGKAPGPQQLFTVHHDVLTARSEFFRAARSSQWMSDPSKATDLEDEDPEVFVYYLNCVYFGVDAIREGWRSIKYRSTSTGELVSGDHDCNDTDSSSHSSNHSSDDDDSQSGENVEQPSEVQKTESGEDLSKDPSGVQSASRSEEQDGQQSEAEDEAKTKGTEDGEIDIDEYYSALIQLYALADKLHDLAMTNLVIDEMICVFEESPSVPGWGVIHAPSTHRLG